VVDELGVLDATMVSMAARSEEAWRC
jgi:hypothetical protein